MAVVEKKIKFLVDAKCAKLIRFSPTKTVSH